MDLNSSRAGHDARLAHGGAAAGVARLARWNYCIGRRAGRAAQIEIVIGLQIYRHQQDGERERAARQPGREAQLTLSARLRLTATEGPPWSPARQPAQQPRGDGLEVRGLRAAFGQLAMVAAKVVRRLLRQIRQSGGFLPAIDAEAKSTPSGR